MSDAAAALVRVARAALATPRLPRPVAVRTAVLLGRLALEAAVTGRLRRDLPGAEAGSMRAQVLCLRTLDARAGAEAGQLHGELSRACHHLPYELGPTADEATALLERVERVVTRVAEATAGGSAPDGGIVRRRDDPAPAHGIQAALPLDGV